MHVLLDCEPQPGLDLLLHGNTHCILGTAHYLFSIRCSRLSSNNWSCLPVLLAANIGQQPRTSKMYNVHLILQVVPIAMSITWARATAAGVISGVLGGCGAGLATWLSLASTYPGGLSASTFVR